jgi:hypothetical protein
MRTGRFCSLIILGPGAPQVLKLHVSRKLMKIVVLALACACLLVALMGYTFPSVDDHSRTRLKAENQALKLEAMDAANGLQVLETKLSALEDQSKRVEELAVAP